MKARFAAALAAFFISSTAQAVVVQGNELPTAILDCFAAHSCVSMTASSPFVGSSDYMASDFDTANMSAFRYYDGWGSSTLTEKWLIRYNVHAPSHELYSSYDSLTNTSTNTTTPFSGYLWLTANQSYDLAEASHQFTLYTEKVTPIPLSLSQWGDNSSAIFNLNSLALFSGSGFEQTYYNNGAIDSQGAMSSYPGNQWNARGFWACIECDYSVQFNLIMLKYLNMGGSAQLTFDTSDSRALLFKQSDYTPDFGSGTSFHEQAYYVQPVPLPAALWLFASGLIGIGTMTRKHFQTKFN